MTPIAYPQGRACIYVRAQVNQSLIIYFAGNILYKDTLFARNIVSATFFRAVFLLKLIVV
jgi:hypothetical protein